MKLLHLTDFMNLNQFQKTARNLFAVLSVPMEIRDQMGAVLLSEGNSIPPSSEVAHWEFGRKCEFFGGEIRCLFLDALWKAEVSIEFEGEFYGTLTLGPFTFEDPSIPFLEGRRRTQITSLSEKQLLEVVGLYYQWILDFMKVGHERLEDHTFFTRFLEQVPGLVLLKNAKTHEIVYANRQYFDTFGFHHLGKGSPTFFEANQKVKKLVDKNGKHRVFQATQVILPRRGKFDFIAEIALDMTERQEGEEALKESEERLRALINAMPDIVCFKDGQGRWLEANDFVLKLLRIDQVSYRGKKDSELGAYTPFYSGALSFCEKTDEEAWQIGVQSRGDEIIPLDNGTWMTFDIIKVPTFTPDGKRKGLTIVGRDITDRKRVEEEREKILEQAQKSAEEARLANHAKDMFLATLSHELKTPLTTIFTWAELLQKVSQEPSKVLRAAHMIGQAAKNQALLINDLLDISRIVSGKLKLDVREIEAEAPVRLAIESVRLTAEEKSIQLSFENLNRNARLAADPAKLQQVLLNLLSNAVKFTPPGGSVKVIMKIENQNLVIRVIDTGQGMSPEFLPRLFEHFSQADPSITRQKGGLGLGLAICRSLVQLHHGSICAESAGIGKGATFTVTFPLFEYSPLAQQATRSSFSLSVSTLPRESQQEYAHQLQGLKVLVVDDEPPACEALSEMLKTLDISVRTASSAKEARHVFYEFQPDLLLSDIAMPEEDGYSLIRSIRALGAKKGGQTPAIAMTAFTATEDAQRAFSAGFQAHLGKPVDTFTLASTVVHISERYKKNLAQNSSADGVNRV
jgi:PAS domain S-box-containing protein